MSTPLKSPHKVKQQRRVLLLALYLLKHHCRVNFPKKKQVLNYISKKHLMHVPADDSDYRQTGDEIWENDLAFRRADLKSEGFIDMPDHGIWRITPLGEADVETWARRVKELTDADPNWADQYKFDPTDVIGFEFYITPETFDWANKIATNALSRS
jgi:hypothetical protein